MLFTIRVVTLAVMHSNWFWVSLAQGKVFLDQKSLLDQMPTLHLWMGGWVFGLKIENLPKNSATLKSKKARKQLITHSRHFAYLHFYKLTLMELLSPRFQATFHCQEPALVSSDAGLTVTPKGPENRGRTSAIGDSFSDAPSGSTTVAHKSTIWFSRYITSFIELLLHSVVFFNFCGQIFSCSFVVNLEKFESFFNTLRSF